MRHRVPAPAAANSYLVALWGGFGLLWLALAVAPYNRADWALENALVLAWVIGLIASRRRLNLSRTSHTAIVAFLALHSIGAHHTYSLVPYDAWAEWATGTTFNRWVGWERNNYDRVIHFAYGITAAFVVHDALSSVAVRRGLLIGLVPAALTMSTSLLYEVIEWAAAALLGGDLGIAYVGAQGDVWDAQKDMALAALGSAIGLWLGRLSMPRMRHDSLRRSRLDTSRAARTGLDLRSRRWRET